MKTAEAPVSEKTSDVKLGTKYEKALRKFVVGCFDDFQKSGVSYNSEKVMSEIREKISHSGQESAQKSEQAIKDNEIEVYNFIEECAKAYFSGKMETFDGNTVLEQARNRIKHK